MPGARNRDHQHAELGFPGVHPGQRHLRGGHPLGRGHLPDGIGDRLVRVAGEARRHFPSREDPVLAAHGHDVDELCAAADDLLRDMPPDQALRAWMDRLASYTVTKQHMSEALSAASSAGPSCG